MLLNLLVRHFEGTLLLTFETQLLYAFVLLLIPPVSGILFSIQAIEFTKMGVAIRSALSAEVYRKAFENGSEIEAGRLMNAFSNDAQTVLLFLSQGAMAGLVSPIQVVVAIYLLWNQVRVAALIGLGFLLVLVPFNIAMFMGIKNYRVR